MGFLLLKAPELIYIILNPNKSVSTFSQGFRSKIIRY